jgi:hypothetical protein
MTFRGMLSARVIIICIPIVVIARLLSKLEKPEAEKAWRALIERNSDCYEYYHGFLNQQGIDLGALPSQTCP